jgi:hypothetical protein
MEERRKPQPARQQPRPRSPQKKEKGASKFKAAPHNVHVHEFFFFSNDSWSHRYKMRHYWCFLFSAS